MNAKPNPQQQEKPSKNIGVEDSVPASTPHVCETCKQEFTSGKALGGHRSHHIEALKNMKKDHQRNNKVISKNNSPSTSFPCSLCDKTFISPHALYGHMRTHNEREWRGMKCPSTSLSSTSSKLLGFLGLLLPNAGRSWLKKDKRGRPSTNDMDAAEALVLLSQGEGHRVNVPSPPQEENEDEEEAVQQRNKRRKKNNGTSSSLPSDWEDELKKGKVQTMMTVESKGEEQLGMNSMEQEAVKSAATPSQRRYECDICGKSLNSHQALGGHKSRHYEGSRKKVEEMVVETKLEEAPLIIIVVGSHGTDEINMMSNEKENNVNVAGHQSSASKIMLDLDLNEPYIVTKKND